MLKKVYMFDEDHIALKAHAVLAAEKLHLVQLRAIRKFADAYLHAPTELRRLGPNARGQLLRRSWMVDEESWQRFTQLRDHTGLTTGQLLHVATRLEIGD